MTSITLLPCTRPLCLSPILIVYLPNDGVSIIPDDGYEIEENTYTMTTGKVVFNKDIPDGVRVKLEFYDFDKNYILTHRFVKGEESESL